MRLKRLELYGYKSFASRTVFEFGDGITAIVGPNGSGKSNVADAIRWVMGEQSYRTLRAQTTEDMIFAGSGRRARLGMAEVIITLDNADNWLPIDYTEVTIGRRAHRSGENEYLLNGQRVRYRDVLDLFESGGLARTSYAVIGQGMVDAALALRPEARRVLFEDAAGIAPLLRKREEALERIAETERNLQRVADILGEIQPRAARLRRQAERAEEHLVLGHDLQELQRIWYGHEWQLRTTRVADCSQRVKEAQERLQAQRAFSNEIEARQAALLAEQTQAQRASEGLAAQQSALRGDAETWRRELAVLDERSKLYAEQAAALVDELRALAVRHEDDRAEIDRLAAELAEQQAGLSAEQSELGAVRAQARQADQSRADLERQAAGVQVQLAKLVGVASDQRARLEQARERRAALLASRESAQAALGELDRRACALEAEGRTLVQKESAMQQEQAQREAARSALEGELAALRVELAEMEDGLRQRRAERDRLAARHDLLGRLRQDLTGHYPGVRDVLTAGNGLRGLLGTVASLMEAPGELEQALESALGPRMQHVVAERWEDAEAAIEHLKRTRSGWATFLPLDTLKTRPALTLEPEAHVRGVASKLVRFDPRLQPVFDLLLGTTVVVDDLPTARRLLAHRGISLIVTLDGETVQPSGALSGGARHQGANLLAQEREWRGLPERVAAAQEELATAQQAFSARQTAGHELQHRLAEAERQMQAARLTRDAGRSAQNQHAQTEREAAREQQWRTSLLAQMSKELDELAAREAASQAALDQAQQQQLDATARLREVQRRLDATRDEALRQRLAQLETRAAVAQRAAASQSALLASRRNSLAQLDQQLATKSGRRDELERMAAELAKERAAASQRLVQAEERLAELAATAGPLRQALEQAQERRLELDKQRALSQDRLGEVEMAHSRSILDRDRASGDQEALARDIEEELGPVNLPEVAAQQLRLSLGDDVVELPRVDTLPAELGNEIHDLKARLRRLGAINPDAPHEYEQILDRETFLRGQDADLRGAIASLHEVIGELDGCIDREFDATFAAVNTAFSGYFQTLFTGGRARLVLTDPHEISNTGVDIVVHLPGKRTENLSLLSGGERALTAVALLFALLKANPVPFCFLDEVDAALDEVNVRRFRQVLEEHARATQFVVITHNRHTMEAAPTIYGISMGEQGVSQCVSLRIDRDAEQIRALAGEA